jgi:Lrp/AsnC family transcriptional regulator for asnA, asnC and gidA
MDDLDIKIISMLQDDARASNAGIARHVSVSEGTVRRRLKRIIQEGFIRVTAALDPAKMGYASEALIGVQADPDKTDQVAEDLARLDEVDWVTITTGAYDVFAWAALQSVEALGIFLRTKVGTIPGVRRTETFVNLSVKKRGYGISV